MKTAEVISIGGRRAVTSSDEFRFTDATVSIRKEGKTVRLEPLRADRRPVGFLANIRIDDPAFAPAPQGETPPAPSI